MAKKINEVTAVSTVANSDYVLLTLADGSIAKVKKSDLYPVATAQSNGLQSAEDRGKRLYFESPTIQGLARKIATYTKRSDFYCDSILIQYNGFGLSTVFNLLLSKVGQNNPNFAIEILCKTAWVSSVGMDVIIVDTGIAYDVYITGSYPSAYTPSVCVAQAGGTHFILVPDAPVVYVSSLTPSHSFRIG